MYEVSSLTILTPNFKLQLRLMGNTLALWVYVDDSDKGTNFKRLCSKSPPSTSTPSGSRWKLYSCCPELRTAIMHLLEVVVTNTSCYIFGIFATCQESNHVKPCEVNV